MSTAPEYPIVYRAQADPSHLYVFASHGEAQNTLEVLEVEDQEYEAWDAAGIRLRLRLRGPSAKDWLEITRVSAASEVKESFLFDAVSEYIRTNGAAVTREPSDTVLTYYMRASEEIKHLRWSGRPWWRKLLGLSNRSARSDGG